MWSFDTSNEAAYPELLTQRVASAIQKFLDSKNVSFEPPPILRINTLAVQHRQHKKRNQLIPEFANTRWLPADTVIHDSQTVMPSSLRGIPRKRSDGEIK